MIEYLDLAIAFVIGLILPIIFFAVDRHIKIKNSEEVYVFLNGDMYQNRTTKDVVNLYEHDVVWVEEKQAYKLVDKQSKTTYYYDKLEEYL